MKSTASSHPRPCLSDSWSGKGAVLGKGESLATQHQEPTTLTHGLNHHLYPGFAAFPQNHGESGIRL